MPSRAEHKTPSGSRKEAIRPVKERKMQKKRDLSFSFQKMSLSLHPHLTECAAGAPRGGVEGKDGGVVDRGGLENR